MKFLILFKDVPRVIAITSQSFNLIRRIAKDKDVIFPNVFAHFDIRTVERTDSQRTIHTEFHITGPGGFRPGQGNLL